MIKTVRILGVNFSLNKRSEHAFSKPYNKHSKPSKNVYEKPNN